MQKHDEQEQVRYNSGGEKLRCLGNGLWVPEGFEIVHRNELDAEVARPKIPIAKIIRCIAVHVITNLTLTLLLNSHLVDANALMIFGVLMFASVFLNLKSIATFFVLLYQKLAPNHVRNRCVFEPSCSSYAILALDKYGIVIGGIKTIGRFSRCKLPNGGEDYP